MKKIVSILGVLGTLTTIPAWAVCGNPVADGSYQCCEKERSGTECCIFGADNQAIECRMMDNSHGGQSPNPQPTCGFNGSCIHHGEQQ